MSSAPAWAGLPRLEWRTVTSSRNPAFWVKGTVLAAAPYRSWRFMIEEVRALDADRNSSAIYRVRDAQSVTDAELREGKTSRVVFHADDLTACIEYCDRVDG